MGLFELCVLFVSARVLYIFQSLPEYCVHLLFVSFHDMVAISYPTISLSSSPSMCDLSYGYALVISSVLGHVFLCQSEEVANIGTKVLLNSRQPASAGKVLGNGAQATSHSICSLRS